MSVWDELTGQSEAIETFRRAAALSADGAASRSMTHSWLITGPPGSGRSNLAYAFATALLSGGDVDGDEAVRRQVQARTHPDLGVLSTERVIITMDEIKGAVKMAAYSPSVADYRVIVIEDADRMQERASNLLLKSLEEPPPRTIWILCAPSEADLLPTIRSRVRSVRLRVPGVDDVAQLLVRRDGVDLGTATRAAREAQSHIGMAHRLATSEDARRRRDETLRTALGIRNVSDAVIAASTMLQLAGDDAKAITLQRDAEEREGALRSLGVDAGGTVPPALRGQLKTLEEDQKRRAKRSLNDGLDRIFVDLMSLYRDILLIQLGVAEQSINVGIQPELEAAARSAPPERTLATLDAITTARERIEGNVAPALALEAVLISAVRRVDGRADANGEQNPTSGRNTR